MKRKVFQVLIYVQWKCNNQPQIDPKIPCLFISLDKLQTLLVIPPPPKRPSICPPKVLPLHHSHWRKVTMQIKINSPLSGEKPLSLFPTRGNNWARRKGLLRGRSDGKPIFESVLHDWLPLWAANWPWRRSPSSCFSPYWGSIDFLSIFSACGDPEHLTKHSPFGQTFHLAY